MCFHDRYAAAQILRSSVPGVTCAMINTDKNEYGFELANFYWFSGNLFSAGTRVPGGLEVVRVCHNNVCRHHFPLQH